MGLSVEESSFDRNQDICHQQMDDVSENKNSVTEIQPPTVSILATSC
jgi:hypothetical protein